MDRSFITRNNASRERLQTLVNSLSDRDLDLVIHGEWTVLAALAHLAFSDRQIQGWLEEWERQGIRESAALREWDQAAQVRLQGQNDVMTPRWLEADSHSIKQEVIAAATSLDAKLESLSPELTEVILATSLFGRRRPWVLDRSIHRHEHLAEIERALGATTELP